MLLLLLFGAMGLMTRLLCADAGGYTSFWPANAAMLMALLILRPRWSIPVLLGCFGLNLYLNRLSNLPYGDATLACVMNVVQAVLVAFPTRRFCGARTDLTRSRRQAVFGTIVLGCTAVEAGIGVFVESNFLGDTKNMVGDWLQWVMCDALGMVLAAPAVILLLRWARERSLPTAIAIEPILLMLAIVLLTVAAFLMPRSFLFFVLYPAMMALAFRVKPAWVLTTMLLVSIVVSAMTAHNLGPIALISPDGSLMGQSMLQPYLWALLLSALPVSNVLGEKRRDARRLSRLRSNLEHAATHDALTGLMTRQLFKSRLRAHLQYCRGGTLLFIDLDHFKRINDTLGHQAGDTVLQSFSERLIRYARSLGGEAARFGGDEFALYLPRMQDGDSLQCAFESLLVTARAPYHVGTATAQLSISIGGASLNGDADHLDEVINHADQALYVAKNAGRNDYRLHDGPWWPEPSLRRDDVAETLEMQPVAASP